MQLIGKSSFTIGSIRKEDFYEMENKAWEFSLLETEEVNKMKEVETLPLGLRRTERLINCRGTRNWVKQNFMIPGNSVVWLENHVGSIEMGWNRYVDPTGKFSDNGAILKADRSDFTVQDINAFCFLVASKTSDSYIYLKNTNIPNWGASVGTATAYWKFEANEGGHCVTAFNDTDYNNTGYFEQRLVYTSQQDFFESHKHLFK
ncbi:hypothetical protein ACTFO4_14295 [Bacillus cereus group sp. MYBKT14-1]|uniref:hypothetical protein n=1 Tax=unclassified Bacillus cereus group TaxID=2750818 RepID=UPI003F78FA6A